MKMENIIDIEKTVTEVEKPKVEKPKVEKSSEAWKPFRSSGQKSCFGHRLGTFANMMDDIFNSGKFTYATAQKQLVKVSGKSEARCKQALSQHASYLPSAKGFEVLENTQTGVLKVVKYQPKSKTK